MNAESGPPGPPSPVADVSVAMGDLRVARHEGTLRTLLGSCVGVALHDPRRRAAGLAHVMLPSAGGRAGPPGKFADTAIMELLRLLDARSAAGRAALVAKVAGGAQMLPFAGATPIGAQNVQAVERILGDLGIPIVARDCGGSRGRRMTLAVASGAVTIEVVGAEPRAL